METVGLKSAPDVVDNSNIGLPNVTVHPKHDEACKQKGAEWWGKKTIKVNERGVPLVTDPTDAIVKITSTCICGSDLHMYNGMFPGMRKGDLVGHEFMGIVESVGPEVKNVKAGDRVVACFDLACGQCMFCKKELYSLCNATNPSKDMQALYGDCTSGIHGYSQLTGGYEGGQAEYSRVIFADVNLLKLPEHNNDDKYVLLSDILPTAWHANELGQVEKGDIVAIWGAGPVGQLAAQCAFARGADRVFIIDSVKYRLEHAKKVAPGVEPIDFSKGSVYDQLRSKVPNGPDVGIECVGMHYVQGTMHKIETTLKLETDPSEILNEIIQCVRKAGRISIIGVYAGYTNHFNIGALMEKGINLTGSQAYCQRYWTKLLKYIEEGKLRPEAVITHHMPLDEAAKGYDVFDGKKDNCVKVVLKTPFGVDK